MDGIEENGLPVGESSEETVVPEDIQSPGESEETAPPAEEPVKDAEYWQREYQREKDQRYALLDKLQSAPAEPPAPASEPAADPKAEFLEAFKESAFYETAVDAYNEANQMKAAYGEDSDEYIEAANKFNRVYARSEKQFREVYETRNELKELKNELGTVKAETLGKVELRTELEKAGITNEMLPGVEAKLVEKFGVNVLNDPNMPPALKAKFAALAAEATANVSAKAPAKPVKPTSIMDGRGGEPVGSGGDLAVRANGDIRELVRLLKKEAG